MFPWDKRWFGLAVESHVAWPEEATTVTFEGREITMRPFDKEHSASVEVDLADDLSSADAHALLRRYLSALAWSEGYFIRELFQGGGGSHAVRFGIAHWARVRALRFIDRIAPIPADPRAQLALALYREALGLTSIAYQVLGFFKIINIVHSTSKAQKTWIASALSHISAADITKRINALQAAGHDVPTYLYESCRCAVAHANAHPVMNPDLIEDDERLRADLPLIRALAAHLMTSELGLKR